MTSCFRTHNRRCTQGVGSVRELRSRQHSPGKVVALLAGREVDVIRSGFMLVTPIVSSEWPSNMRSRQFRSPSMISSLILVRRARSGRMIGDLCSIGMRPSERSSEADTATRNLRASCVATNERCDDRDGGATSSTRRDNSRFRIHPFVDRDCLAFTKASHALCRGNSCSYTSGSTQRSGACSTNGGENRGFSIRTRI